MSSLPLIPVRLLDNICLPLSKWEEGMSPLCYLFLDFLQDNQKIASRSHYLLIINDAKILLGIINDHIQVSITV